MVPDGGEAERGWEMSGTGGRRGGTLAPSGNAGGLAGMGLPDLPGPSSTHSHFLCLSSMVPISQPYWPLPTSTANLDRHSRTVYEFKFCG